MKTITNISISETVINKSRFIAILIRCDNVDLVNSLIDKVKKDYKDATHYCYGYIINNFKRCSDDGEPSGTAGLPILSTLEKNNISNVICIVIRYFGGIKLGSGGLIRAYRRATTDVIKKSDIKELYEGFKLEIYFTYENKVIIDNIINKSSIITINYMDNIMYELLITKNDYEIIKKQLQNLCKKIKEKENVFI